MEYSNNNLAILLVLTAVVIIVGTIIGLYRIEMIDQGMGATGAVTGTVDITVSSTTYITVSGSIDLGTLTPGSWNASENSSLGGSADPMAAWNNTKLTSNFTVPSSTFSCFIIDLLSISPLI